jgi:hypothetical protein
LRVLRAPKVGSCHRRHRIVPTCVLQRGRASLGLAEFCSNHVLELETAGQAIDSELFAGNFAGLFPGLVNGARDVPARDRPPLTPTRFLALETAPKGGPPLKLAPPLTPLVFGWGALSFALTCPRYIG